MQVFPDDFGSQIVGLSAGCAAPPASARAESTFDPSSEKAAMILQRGASAFECGMKRYAARLSATNKPWNGAVWLGLVLQLCCTGSNRYAHAKPLEIDLVGTWAMLEDAPGHSSGDCKLKLGLGGDLVVEYLPDWWQCRDVSTEPPAKWRLVRNDGIWEIVFVLNPRCVVGARVVGQHAPYGLEFSVDDPDYEHVVRFGRSGM